MFRESRGGGKSRLQAGVRNVLGSEVPSPASHQSLPIKMSKEFRVFRCCRANKAQLSSHHLNCARGMTSKGTTHIGSVIVSLSFIALPGN